MLSLPSLAAWLFLADLLLRLGLIVRVVMRRLAVGVTLAWITIVLVFPILGTIVYLLIGELRLGKHRQRRIDSLMATYHRWLARLKEHSASHRPAIDAELTSLARLAERVALLPPLVGNRLELISETDAILRRLIVDIDAARESCHLEFYIWNNGGLADEVAEALQRAAARGVECRLLVDSVGSHTFLASDHRRLLQENGVRVQEALPASLVRMLFVRFDLRLHRKLVVIDSRVAYTGSLNLVDPRYFKQSAGVGEWVDAMARIEGPVVEPLEVTFLADWIVENDEPLDSIPAAVKLTPPAECGESVVQVLPSGPNMQRHSIREVLLSTIYVAREELILTTPYFVPDESLLSALISAAMRGVAVTLILPARVDSRLVRFASRAHFGDLIRAGVRVMQYQDGLLHTKSVSVDGRMCLFGTMNLDLRSLVLNFELTLAIYDRDFTGRLRQLQQSYLEHSTPVDLAAWNNRTALQKFADNVGRLWGPLL